MTVKLCPEGLSALGSKQDSFYWLVAGGNNGTSQCRLRGVNPRTDRGSVASRPLSAQPPTLERAVCCKATMKPDEAEVRSKRCRRLDPVAGAQSL
jgi:hypothetical protein